MRASTNMRTHATAPAVGHGPREGASKTAKTPVITTMKNGRPRAGGPGDDGISRTGVAGVEFLTVREPSPNRADAPPLFAPVGGPVFHAMSGGSPGGYLRPARANISKHGKEETMTTLEDRPNTALLVVDVQSGVVAAAHERDAVVTNIGSLVEKARREGVPVVWVQHSDEGLVKGTDEWRIVPELTPHDAEAVVQKNYGDSFEDTTLETVLSGVGVGRLIVVGAETDACIRSTLHGAFVRGYDTTLVSDAHTTGDQTEWGAPSPDQVIAHTNLYWTYQTAPGRTAGTVETKDVDFVEELTTPSR
jgi:nicotinamidase-related amidase